MSEQLSLKDHVQKYNENRLPQDRGLVCHAPFVSLNFEQTGKVTACCYNRTHVVGNYPQNSVAEIWNSPAINELRTALENLDFNKGCQKCEESLMSRNYFSPLMKNYDKLKMNGWESAKTGPRIFEFELSNLCNLECTMCTGFFSSSIRKNREKLPALKFPWDDQFVEQLRPYWKNIEWAKFLGGEPFLNPLYFKIWDQIAEENPAVKVVITTNGTILNNKVQKVLQTV
ncbi:MAG: SPASM domain-containing protein, partial [Pseudobdellovibrionaceae bacterium]